MFAGLHETEVLRRWIHGTVADTNSRTLARLAASAFEPAPAGFRVFATSGGLISYGTNPSDQFRRGASYVDRILKGEKPVDLPVQAPTKYELVINLKTAKALGIKIPPTLLTRAGRRSSEISRAIRCGVRLIWCVGNAVNEEISLLFRKRDCGTSDTKF